MAENPTSIELGAMSDKISVQLAGSKIPQKELIHFDKDADAITRCHLRGYLSDSATHRARLRLAKLINKKGAEYA